MIAPQFLRFLVAGVLNTAATYLIYLALLTRVEYITAYTVAYVAGIPIAYVLASRFVFRTSLSIHAFIKFPVVYLFQYIAGTVIVWAGVNWFGIRKEYAALIAIAVTVPLTFALTRAILKTRTMLRHERRA